MMNIVDIIGKLSITICLIAFLNSIIGDMKFKSQYSYAEIKSFSKQNIDTLTDPLQKNITNPKYIKHKGEKNVYALLPQAEYSLSGYVVAVNTNFWLRNIMRNNFDEIALIDIGIVWGELAKSPELLKKHIKFKSYKTLGSARSLNWRYKKLEHETPWNIEYAKSHIAHTHIIPANTNVMSALLKIKKGSIVKLDGYLVDIYTDKSVTTIKTSLSRYDTNPTSRGNGACEIMYVTQVQIKDKIYN